MKSENEKIRVLIVSHQCLFRQGIEHSLSDFNDIEITGTADINGELTSMIDPLPPDIALVDIDGINGDGMSLARELRQRSPNIALVMLTSNPTDTQLFQAIKAQAVAYLCKEITAPQLIDTIRRVASGEHPINESLTTRPKAAEQVLSQFQELCLRSNAGGLISSLTLREIDILKLIAQGYINKEIAFELGISEQTIKNHVTSILRKLNANVRTEAVVVAIKEGLISIN